MNQVQIFENTKTIKSLEVSKMVDNDHSRLIRDTVRRKEVK